MSPKWKQTTAAVVKDVDKIIFMEESHYTFFKENFPFLKKKYEIWNISDISGFGTRQNKEIFEDDLSMMKEALSTFSKIEKKIDQLDL